MRRPPRLPAPNDRLARPQKVDASVLLAKPTAERASQGAKELLSTREPPVATLTRSSGVTPSRIPVSGIPRPYSTSAVAAHTGTLYSPSTRNLEVDVQRLKLLAEDLLPSLRVVAFHGRRLDLERAILRHDLPRLHGCATVQIEPGSARTPVHRLAMAGSIGFGQGSQVSDCPSPECRPRPGLFPAAQRRA